MQGLTVANVLAGGAIVDMAGADIRIGQSLRNRGGDGGLVKLAPARRLTVWLALTPCAQARRYVLTCEPADYGIGEGPPPFVTAATGNTIRVGANDNATPVHRGGDPICRKSTPLSVSLKRRARTALPAPSS